MSVKKRKQFGEHLSREIVRVLDSKTKQNKTKHLESKLTACFTGAPS